MIPNCAVPALLRSLTQLSIPAVVSFWRPSVGWEIDSPITGWRSSLVVEPLDMQAEAKPVAARRRNTLVMTFSFLMFGLLTKAKVVGSRKTGSVPEALPCCDTGTSRDRRAGMGENDMSYYEYRVVPAPRSLAKVQGAKDPEERYGRTLELALNAHGRDGWEFQRIETVTTVIKRGFFARGQPETMTVLVFRRLVETSVAAGWDLTDAPDAAPARRTTGPVARHEVDPPLRPVRGDERS